MARIMAYCEGCNHELYESDISAIVPDSGVDDATVLTCPNCDRINALYSETIA
jgi:predicted  nucleic acid-binding Zn-ribbon protein